MVLLDNPDGNKWVKYGGARMAYGCLRGGLKNVVHTVMSQNSLMSALRG